MTMPARPGDRAFPIRLPERIAALVARVRGACGPVFAVGGVVRDAWLGLTIDDWDFAVAAGPGEVRRALGIDAAPTATDRLGRVAVAIDGVQVVITTFRVESDYGPERWPRHVAFVTTPAADAARRDFTANAIYVDTADGTVVDPVGGAADLAARRLRVIGVPKVRFDEDPLRILRAVRFEASRGLVPTPRTAAAMAECAPRCAELAPARRFVELDRAFREPNAAGALLRLLDTGALGAVIAVLAGDEHRVRSEALRAFAMPGDADAVGRWAALFGDASLAASGLASLDAPRAVRDAVARRLALAESVEQAVGAGALALQRVLRLATPADIRWIEARLEVRCADAVVEQLRDAWARVTRPDLATAMPSGAELIRRGLAPGPAIGAVLATIRDRLECEHTLDPLIVEQIVADEVARVVKPGRKPGR